MMHFIVNHVVAEFISLRTLILLTDSFSAKHATNLALSIFLHTGRLSRWKNWLCRWLEKTLISCPSRPYWRSHKFLLVDSIEVEGIDFFTLTIGHSFEELSRWYMLVFDYIKVLRLSSLSIHCSVSRAGLMSGNRAICWFSLVTQGLLTIDGKCGLIVDFRQLNLLLALVDARQIR